MENLYIYIYQEVQFHASYVTRRVGERSIVSTGEKHGEKKLRKLREEEDVSKSKVRFRNYYWTGREERDRKRGRRVRWKIVAGIKVYRSFSEITEMHTYIYMYISDVDIYVYIKLIISTEGSCIH